MTLEEKIDEMLDRYYRGWPEVPLQRIFMIGKDFDDERTPTQIKFWVWQEEPQCFKVADYTYSSHDAVGICFEIDQLINRASPVECLTSSSEYIRECKKWILDKGFKS